MKDGGVRHRVEFRAGGREAPTCFGGSFETLRLARLRRMFILGELAAGRMPELSATAEPVRATSFADAARRWQASRVDVAEATTVQHRSAINRALPLLGERRVDEITPQEIGELIADLHAKGKKRETIRKTRTAVAMVFDLERITPNPARDQTVKLPREEAEEIQPPSAVDVEKVYRRLLGGHRLALLWLDWSGARVASVDKTLVDDYDESRRRVRLRAATTKTRRALWVELHPLLADALEATLPHRRFRDSEARLFADSGADALRTAIAKACKAEGILPFSPHDLRHRRISLLHLRGVPWARIGEFVGQRNLAVTANTYSHVLIDEAEVDYPGLLGEGSA